MGLRLIPLVLAVLLTLMAAAPVQAAGDISQYKAVKVKMVGGDKKRVASTTLGAAAWGYVDCWTQWQGAAAYGLVGNKLWTWRMKIDWCGDGDRIVYRYIRKWGEVYAPFWSWREVSSDTSLNTAIPQRLYSWAQAEFKLCVLADIGCIQFRYPWIEGRVWANGAVRWEIGG